MQPIDKEIIATVVLAAILMLLLSFIVILSIIRYQRKQRIYFEEKQTLKFAYEQELLKSRLEMQEQTFSMISQEIHDNVGQILSLAKVQISIMKESQRGDQEMLDEVSKNIGAALSDLRDISRSLNSERIRRISIYNAVGIETERINKSGVLRAKSSVSGQELPLNEQKKLILFRIIQECLQNILKHADATDINIAFVYCPDNLQVYVVDNGRGFNVAEVEQSGTGLGLSHIKTRVALAGGKCKIDSTESTGTTILIEIPFEHEK